MSQRYLFVVCRVLQREAYFVSARSPNIIDIRTMPQGLHNEPDKLRSEVQTVLQTTTDGQGNAYDAILLGYALCSNGIAGLTCPLPMVVPRGHDCMTLLLGSKERYKSYFDSHPGIYWYSAGWIEHSLQPGPERYEQTLNHYREKYGDENAQYLMEMEQNWMREYSWATYVDWNLPLSDEYRTYTRQCAEYLKWKFDEIPGDPGLMQKLVDGVWDDRDFLMVAPGQKIFADVNNPGIIRAE